MQIPTVTPEDLQIKENITENSEFGKLLHQYTPEVRNAFLGIPEFAGDEIVQPGEKKALDSAQFIFDDPDLKAALEELGGTGNGKIKRTIVGKDGKDPLGRQVERYGITLDIHNPHHLRAFMEVMYGYNPKTPQDFSRIFEKYGISDSVDPYAGLTYIRTIDEKYEAQAAVGECGACIREGIKGLAHSLWLEGARSVPWSLNDYDKEELEAIIAPRPSAGFAPGWTDAYPYVNDIIKGSRSQKEAVEKIVEWSRKNMVHFLGDEEGFRMEDAYGKYNYTNFPIKNLLAYRTKAKDPQLNWHVDNKIPVGATQASGIVVALSRSANIPAEEIFPPFSHSNFYFPTLGLHSNGNWVVDIYITKAPLSDTLVDGPTAEKLFFSAGSNAEHNRMQLQYSLDVAKKNGIPITKK